MTIFDRILTTDQVEAQAIGVLKAWIPTYLAELERQTSREPGSLPVPRAWTTATSFDKWPEDQLPAVLVISPGILDPPDAEGNGSYRVRFSLGIGVIVSAATMEQTAALAKTYIAALRAIMIQRPSLGGFAEGVTWLDENYDDIPFDDFRSLGAGQAIFAVEVRNVTSRNAGPLTPDDGGDGETIPTPPQVEPYPEWPLVTDADVAIKAVPLTETIEP